MPTWRPRWWRTPPRAASARQRRCCPGRNLAISNLAASARLQPRSSSDGGASGSGAGQAPGNLRPKQKMGSSTDTTKPESLLPKLSWFSTNATADMHGVVGVSEGRGGAGSQGAARNSCVIHVGGHRRPPGYASDSPIMQRLQAWKWWTAQRADGETYQDKVGGRVPNACVCLLPGYCVPSPCALMFIVGAQPAGGKPCVHARLAQKRPQAAVERCARFYLCFAFVCARHASSQMALSQPPTIPPQRHNHPPLPADFKKLLDHIEAEVQRKQAVLNGAAVNRKDVARQLEAERQTANDGNPMGLTSYIRQLPKL